MNDNFTEIRFEFYAAARTLWFNGQMRMGALNFGYCVELHLKHALQLRGYTGKLLTSHDVVKLWNECLQSQGLDRSTASMDLVHFVNDCLDARYPSQRIRTGKRAIQRNHAIGMALPNVLALDDLVLKLDEWLVAVTDDVNLSVLMRAARSADTHNGRIVFHSNHAAQKRIRYIVEFLEQRRGEFDTTTARTAAVAQLDELVAFFQSGDSLSYASVETYISPGTSADPASDFVYPGRVFRNSKGDIVGAQVSG